MIAGRNGSEAIKVWFSIPDVPQGRADERVSAVDRGGPFAATVEATRMSMVVTDPTVSGNPIVYTN